MTKVKKEYINRIGILVQEYGSQERFAAALNLNRADGHKLYNRDSINNWLGDRSKPDFDSLISIATTFNVSIDWILGNAPIEKRSPDTSVQGAIKITGLSEKAINYLQRANRDRADTAGKQTISFINRVLENPSKSYGSAAQEGTLLSWLEEYITCGTGTRQIPIQQASGLVEYINVSNLYREHLMSRVRALLDEMREEQ